MVGNADHAVEANPDLNDSRKPCPFLDILPREIRDQIYGYVLIFSKITPSGRGYLFVDTRRILKAQWSEREYRAIYSWYKRVPTTIFRANKQIYNEASEVFFQKNNFTFNLVDPLKFMPQYRLHQYPPRMRKVHFVVKDPDVLSWVVQDLIGTNHLRRVELRLLFSDEKESEKYKVALYSALERPQLVGVEDMEVLDADFDSTYPSWIWPTPTERRLLREELQNFLAPIQEQMKRLSRSHDPQITKGQRDQMSVHEFADEYIRHFFPETKLVPSPTLSELRANSKAKLLFNHVRMCLDKMDTYDLENEV